MLPLAVTTATIQPRCSSMVKPGYHGNVISYGHMFLVPLIGHLTDSLSNHFLCLWLLTQRMDIERMYLRTYVRTYVSLTRQHSHCCMRTYVQQFLIIVVYVRTYVICNRDRVHLIGYIHLEVVCWGHHPGSKEEANNIITKTSLIVRSTSFVSLYHGNHVLL